MFERKATWEEALHIHKRMQENHITTYRRCEELAEAHNRLLDHLGLEEKVLSGTEIVMKEDL